MSVLPDINMHCSRRYSRNDLYAFAVVANLENKNVKNQAELSRRRRGVEGRNSANRDGNKTPIFFKYEYFWAKIFCTYVKAQREMINADKKWYIRHRIKIKISSNFV